jgi:toxin ParE1/3/4
VKSKPVIPREQANLDVDEAISHYLEEGAVSAAIGLIDALEQAYGHISRHPATGSPRYAHELNLPSLRTWPLTRYPYLVFYAEQDDHIAVWRVLHNRRDIPVWMQQEDDMQNKQTSPDLGVKK